MLFDDDKADEMFEIKGSDSSNRDKDAQELI